MKRLLNSPSLRRMLAEVVLISCGVLLALAVDQWNTNRIMHRRVAEALVNISSEVNSNLRVLDAIHPNNAAVLQLIDEDRETEEEGDPNFVPGLQIQDTAWQTMLSTGISEHLDYDTLYQLSSLYSLQEIYKSLGYQILETILSSKILIYAMNPGIGEEDLDDQIYRDQIALFVEAEAQLLKVMQDTRRLLETVNGE